MLLDQERWTRLAQESQRTGRSVGAIVRDALDRHFSVADVQAQRAAAIEWLLARPAGSGPDWEETKRLLDEEIEERLR